MVRFLTSDTAANEAELREARGHHRIFFDEGDQGLALKARAPWLSWEDTANGLSVAYADFADITLRYMSRESGGLSADFLSLIHI